MPDCNFMDAAYIKEHDVINRYSQNRLTPEESVAFEEYFLDKPDILEQLEMDYVLANKLDKTDFQNEPNSFWNNPIFAWTWAGVSTFACVLFLFFSPFNLLNTINEDKVELYYFTTLRSNDEQPPLVLSLEPDTNSVVFVLSSPEPEGTDYLIEIIDDILNEVVFSKQFAVNDLGEMYIVVNRELFTTKDYKLRYQSPNGEVEYSVFRVR